MGEIIAIKGRDEAAYEELLLERDALRKEASNWEISYMRAFGEAIEAVFRKKVDCIAKKKSIAFCQAAVNRGKPVDAAEMETYLAAEMAEYERQLAELVSDCAACRGAKPVPEHTYLLVKEVYRRIVKQIHPDKNPEFAADPVFAGLWAQVAGAYAGSDLEALQELEVMVRRALENAGFDAQQIAIPNLAEKIAKLKEEISAIRATDPYQYRFLLADPVAVAEKKRELQKELEAYAAYEAELIVILQGYLKNGVIVTWREN